MIDWGDEAKPRTHDGIVGLDETFKIARRGGLQEVRAQLRRDPSLLHAKTMGHNRTFLWEAVRGNRLPVVNYLLELGADANVPGRIRSEITVLLPPYCIARHYRRTEIAERLLRAGAAIDIYSACFLGDEKQVAKWLKKNPKLLSQEQPQDSVWRVTPLHFAVAGGQMSLAQGLIDRGAPVKPYTRLLCNTAVRMGYPELIPILLEGGADPKLARVWSVRVP